MFAEWDPYRAHASKRKAFNDNDPIPEGVHSEVARAERAYSAKAVLVVKDNGARHAHVFHFSRVVFRAGPVQ